MEQFFPHLLFSSNRNEIEDTPECLTTDDSPKKKIPCKFPFKLKGKTYNTCTTATDPDNKNWCSTKTDSNGKHMRGQWGYCDQNCPLE